MYREKFFWMLKKDEKHPFIVKTTHLEVSVLGTAFNVNDYAKNVETRSEEHTSDSSH